MKFMLEPSEWCPVWRITATKYADDYSIELTKAEFEELQELSKKFAAWQNRLMHAVGETGCWGNTLGDEEVVWEEPSKP